MSAQRLGAMRGDYASVFEARITRPTRVLTRITGSVQSLMDSVLTRLYSAREGSTWEGLASTWNQYVEFCGSNPVEDFGAEWKMLLFIETKLENKTLQSLGSALTYMKRLTQIHDQLEIPYMKMVTAEYKSALKHQGAERPLWQAPPAEILDIHRCATLMTPDEYLGLLVAWRTASRIGDLNAVLNEHLRLERREASGMYLWTVQFVKTKGDPFMIGQVVPFYLTEEENYMMTRHLASHPPSQKFTPLTTARAQQVLGAVREGLTAHSVKRGALIMMLRRGVPIQMIQWIAKHRDLHTLLIYLPQREVSLALGLHEATAILCP